jgi:hypothetical protein
MGGELRILAHQNGVFPLLPAANELDGIAIGTSIVSSVT